MRENRSLDEFLEPSTDRSASRTDESSGADDSVAQRDGDDVTLEEDGDSEPSEVEEDGDSEPSEGEEDGDSEPSEIEEDGDSEPSESAGGDSERGESAGDATGETASATDSTLEPLQPTLRWSPDGVTCSACDERASRLWQDDGGLVCPDCKSW